ncbi:MAG: chorismate lyase [Gammaproteobacteria bacterium]|nr:chorismate lyase [Gammaproteobacteria bacterium]
MNYAVKSSSINPTHLNWQAKLPADIAPNLANWLSDSGSLTLRLQQLPASVSHQLLNANWQSAYPDEAHPLSITNDQAWVREITRSINNKVNIFGRSLIPKKTLQQCPELKQAGKISIGQILFADKNLRRLALEFAMLSKQHPLYQSVCQYLMTQPDRLIARRSVFIYQQNPLLITEIFLPEFIHWTNV